MRLLLLYVVVEIAALAAVVSWFGFGITVMLLLAGAVVGQWLVRREGSRTALAMAEAVKAGRIAYVETTDGALIGLAGLLILVPGVVSDVLGLLLVLPPTRALVRRELVRRAERRSPLLRDARIRTGGPVVDGTVVTGTATGGPGSRVPGGRGADRPVARGMVIEGSVVPGPAAEPPHRPAGS